MAGDILPERTLIKNEVAPGLDFPDIRFWWWRVCGVATDHMHRFFNIKRTARFLVQKIFVCQIVQFILKDDEYTICGLHVEKKIGWPSIIEIFDHWCSINWTVKQFHNHKLDQFGMELSMNSNPNHASARVQRLNRSFVLEFSFKMQIQ